MTTSDNLRAGLEAPHDVPQSTEEASRHEAAMKRYLMAMQQQEQTGDPRSSTTGGRPGPASGSDDAGAVQGTMPEANAQPSPRGQALRQMGRTRTNLIVAGLDASAASRNAVDWAAAEAVRRHAALRLVHAYTLPVAGYPGYNPIPDSLETQLRIDGRALLDEVAGTIRNAYPNLAVTTHLAKGHALTALRHESENCLLTVVGSRGTGRVTGILLGSVALAIVSTNAAPVAVIHPGQQTTAHGPVVVGVDGSPTSESAIDFAFETAERWKTRLIAVHCWYDTVQGTFPMQPMLVDPAAIEEAERALLAERIAGWHDKYSDVPVQQAVVRGRPTPTLLEYGRSAQLVVVGSHGRGGFTGMLLGSTSQALVSHSSSPVVVVRPD